MRTKSAQLDVAARVRQLMLLCQAETFKQLALWLLRDMANAITIRALYVTARVKQLMLVCHAARFKQVALWLISDLANANTIHAVVRNNKG
jgi:adenosine deaminase